MTVNFRPARTSDAETAVALIYSSGPEAFEYGFSHADYKAKDFLQFAFLDGRGLFGWRNHTVATLEDKVVGIGAFYSGREYWRLSLELIAQEMRFYSFSTLPSLFQRNLQLQALMPPPSFSTHYVAHFTVAESHRGQGIGTALLNYQQTVAKTLKRKTYALDVAVDNPKAYALYQRLGFKPVKLQKFPGQTGSVPDTWHMEMPL